MGPLKYPSNNTEHVFFLLVTNFIYLIACFENRKLNIDFSFWSIFSFRHKKILTTHNRIID